MLTIAPEWKAFETTAKTRKRCPNCNRMVEVGDPCVARDGTYVKSAQHWIAQGAYKRGAWHLYHTDCWVAFMEAVAESDRRNKAEADTRLAELRARVQA